MAAVVLFVLALFCLLGGTFYYIYEVTMALSSVRDEACDARFMDLWRPTRDSRPQFALNDFSTSGPTYII
jgi:hypothetical protein